MKFTKILTVLTLACAAQAATISATSSGGIAVIDGGPHTVDITITDTRTITGNFSVTLNTLAHTWMGDLTATVTRVGSGTTATLFHRIGVPDNPSVCVFNDFSGNYTFSDAATAPLPCSSGNIPGGTYRASGVDDTAILIANLFNGQTATGTWRLSIFDAVRGDNGSLGSWTLNLDVTVIPEPATVGITALGLMAALIVRRWK